MKVGDLVRVRYGYGSFRPSKDSREICDGDIGIVVDIEGNYSSNPWGGLVYCMINGHKVLFETYGLELVNNLGS